MAKNDNLTDFVTDIADTLRTALKQDPTHKINPQDFSGIITDIANGSTIETEDITITPSETTQVVNRSDGKYINKVTVNPIQTETLSVTPTQSEQTINAPQSKYYKEVNVSAVTNSIDPNITSENIKKDVTILGVTGTLESGGGNDDTQQLIDLIEGDITTLNIPNTTSKIRNYAFYENSSITNITIPDSMTSIGGSAFKNCSRLTSITIPDSVTSIGGSAFASCRGLTSVTIGSGVTRIEDETFYSCSNLTSITIGDGVTSIGNYSFQSCSSLKSITIPSGVTYIGQIAFYSCSQLKEMTILAMTPPTLSSTNAIASATSKIYIPAGTLSAYQTATNWSSFASKFVELNEDGSKPE